MDEPTTHLDIQSIDALVGALKNYEGTLIFISHDVHFIRALAQTVLHVHSGRLDERLGTAGVPRCYVALPWATHAFDFTLQGPGGQLSTFAVDWFLDRVTGA
jgi:energy-coupling factor transporter ATP-binding protein EcfA2